MREPLPIFGDVRSPLGDEDGADATMILEGSAVVVFREDGSREVFNADEVRSVLEEAA